MASDRRKRKLVNISVQKAIALRIVAHSLLFACSVFLLCVLLLNMTSPEGRGPPQDRIHALCLTAIGVSTVVVLPAIFYDSIKFSHRMAGPVLRVKNILPSIGLEKLGHVSLRKNDFWQEFATDVNDMLDRVEVLRQAAAATPASSDSTDPKNPEASSPGNGAMHA